MTASTNSLLISVGILFVLVLADPCINSIIGMVRRAVRGRDESYDPILAALAEPQTAPAKERNAA
jgi:hypothetical protein